MFVDPQDKTESETGSQLLQQVHVFLGPAKQNQQGLAVEGAGKMVQIKFRITKFPSKQNHYTFFTKCNNDSCTKWAIKVCVSIG